MAKDESTISERTIPPHDPFASIVIAPIATETITQEEVSPAFSLSHSGEDCARHFLSMITEGAHLDRIQVFLEEGNTLEQTMIALLKAVLDSDIRHAARSFMEEAGVDAQRGVGDVVERPCHACRLLFIPKRTGQLFCCNACSYRAEGLSPVVEHEESCRLVESRPSQKAA